MAEHVRRLGSAISLALVVVALALGYWQFVRADDVRARPDNPRGIEEERRALRGRILDRNGEVLAQSRRAGELAVRVYPYPPLAHVTGYVSARFGKTGVEAAFDPYLRGDRAADVLTEIRGALLGRAAVGTDVVLTLDLRLQRIADEVLGSNQGAVVVVNAATGELLALASHPAYDPNRIDEEWDRLTGNPDSPFVHRALQGLYVPGSVFKLVTAAAALDLGLAEPEERHRHLGDLIVDGFRIRNTNHPNLVELSFAEEFAWSCNDAFALTGLMLGQPGRIDYSVLGADPYVWIGGDVRPSAERLRAYASRFQIGAVLPVELPSSAGRFAASAQVSPVLLATTSFGQGELQVTPLHMALAAAAVVNGGELPSPYMVARARSGGADRVVGSQRTLARVMSPAAANALNRMMVRSVEEAYAQPARIPGVQVGGKTGTAEVGNATAHSWFVGYAPAERPGVAIAVIMENRGSGSEFATPAARAVLEVALALGY